MTIALLFSPVTVNAGNPSSWSFWDWLAGLFDNQHSSSPADNSSDDPQDRPADPEMPAIDNSEASAEFIADQISSETGWEEAEVLPYAEKLAETLSQLSPAAQQWVFFGS